MSQKVANYAWFGRCGEDRVKSKQFNQVFGCVPAYVLGVFALFGLDAQVYFSFCLLLISLCSLDLAYFICMLSVHGPCMPCCSNEYVCGIVCFYVFIHRHTHTYIYIYTVYIYIYLCYIHHCFINRLLDSYCALPSDHFGVSVKVLKGIYQDMIQFRARGPCYASQEQATPDTITSNVTCWLTFPGGG